MTGPQPAPLCDREPAGRLMEVDPGSLKIQSLCCELQRARATSQSQMQTNNSPKPAGRPRQRPRTCAPPPTPPHPQHSRPLLVPHGAQDEGWLPGPGDLCDVLQFCGAQGRVGRSQAGAGPPPPLHWSWGQTWSCAFTHLSLAGASTSHPLQGLFIPEYNWPLREQ